MTIMDEGVCADFLDGLGFVLGGALGSGLGASVGAMIGMLFGAGLLGAGVGAASGALVGCGLGACAGSQAINASICHEVETATSARALVAAVPVDVVRAPRPLRAPAARVAPERTALPEAAGAESPTNITRSGRVEVDDVSLQVRIAALGNWAIRSVSTS